jgi:hypothetical protein
MDAHKISVKLFLDGAIASDWARAVVPVMHGWIQGRRLDELMIDVVDYAHVHQGPGIALICDAANYFLDEAGGRQGLSYQRKRDGEGSFDERLSQAVSRALAAARLLEGEAALGGVKLRGDELLVRIHDRLRAPNTAETFQAVRPAVEALARKLWPQGAAIVHLADPKELFGVRVTAEGSDATVEGLLQRLARQG